MSRVKKTLKTAAVTAAIGTGAYLATGGILYESVLGRMKLNRSPEEILNIPANMQLYLTNENFRNADDWYIENVAEDTLLKNEKGEVLHAKIFDAPEKSNKWAVVLHGYTCCPRDMALQAHHFYKLGFNTLLPFQRGHKNSEQMHSTMGYFERYDVVAWINYIISVYPDAEIVVMGSSMGGATTMLVTGEDLPNNVKCAVSDCGYTSCWDMCEAQIGNYLHLPKFPFLYAANSFSKLVMKWDFKDCSPLKAVSHSVTPTLFIHGELDSFVPFTMLDTLYNACSAEKDMLLVPDALHNDSCKVHPEIYWEKIDGFVGKYIDIKAEN